MNLDDRVVPGLRAFAERETTYGEMREMARMLTRDRNGQTAAEQGLAIGLLAALDDFEAVLNELASVRRTLSVLTKAMEEGV